MKKIIYIILILITFSYFLNNKESLLIPNDSIRFRIIANSNSNIDQNTKIKIKQDLQKNFFPLLENAKTKEETKNIIKENESVIKKTLNSYNIPYTINYGSNYFPQKEYKGITYEDGDYESLVISLGEAKGNNWWCVMYPPLCMLESNSDKYEDVEYKFYIEEVLSKLTS